MPARADAVLVRLAPRLSATHGVIFTARRHMSAATGRRGPPDLARPARRHSVDHVRHIVGDAGQTRRRARPVAQAA